MNALHNTNEHRRLISIVVPCFNEEATVEELHRRIAGLMASMDSFNFELIFVNDGSTDGTGEKLNRLAENTPYVKVLHLARNRGHQIALTAGMDYAAGDIIVTMDADLQHPPEFVADLVAKVEEGYDIVHAQRRKRHGEHGVKRITAKLFYVFMRYFSGIRLIENCGDFRAFTRPVLETVKSFRMPHRFLRGIFVQLGFRQAVIPYEGEARFRGRTKYSFAKMMNLAIDGVLGFSATPIRFIIWLSVMLWGLSLIHLVQSLIRHFVYRSTVPGWTSIVVLLFFFTGLILFSIAIIGSYVGRIFMQGQNIPLYWLQDVRNIDRQAIEEQSKQLREAELLHRVIRNQRDDTR